MLDYFFFKACINDHIVNVRRLLGRCPIALAILFTILLLECIDLIDACLFSHILPQFNCSLLLLLLALGLVHEPFRFNRTQFESVTILLGRVVRWTNSLGVDCLVYLR